MSLFKPNPAFIASLRGQAATRLALEAEAERARAKAEAIAQQARVPWMPRKGNSGQTIVVDVDGRVVRLVNTDHAGHLQEWGSKNNPAHAPLRRGVRAAGLRLREHGR